MLKSKRLEHVNEWSHYFKLVLLYGFQYLALPFHESLITSFAVLVTLLYMLSLHQRHRFREHLLWFLDPPTYYLPYLALPNWSTTVKGRSILNGSEGLLAYEGESPALLGLRFEVCDRLFCSCLLYQLFRCVYLSSLLDFYAWFLLSNHEPNSTEFDECFFSYDGF